MMRMSLNWIVILGVVRCTTPPAAGPVDPLSVIVDPDFATSQSTQQLLMEHPMPPTQVATCWKQIQADQGGIVDERDLLHAKRIFGSKVQEKRALYHWCFYYMTEDLGDRLRVDALSFQKKVELFYDSMKTLWVLARTLDAAAWQAAPKGETDKQRYFEYLRMRYMEISKESLGREVKEVAHPLDESREQDERDQVKGAKPPKSLK
jgi:hypothetical protein